MATKKKGRYSGIGGQAVLEGIMMKNKDKYAVAVRKADGEIEVDIDEYTGVTKGNVLKNLPFLRGVFNFIDSLLDEYASIPKDDKNAISRKLAEILDNVNYGHFFREGNGRTQREFIRELAIQKGYSLDLNPMDDARVYERYMHGTTFGEIDGLRDLIFEILQQIDLLIFP